MASKLHRIHIPKVGEALLSLDGGTPYEADDKQKYPLGTLLRLGGRTYAYAKASGTQIPDVGSQVGCHQHVAQCTVAVSAAAGATSLVIDRPTTAGAAHNGIIAENELQGGYIVVFPTIPSNNKVFVRQITGNSAAPITAANEMTVYLDSPTPIAVVADTSYAEAMASPYLNVVTAASEVASVIGVPTVAATDGQYFWLQTWGPVWLATSAGCGAGNSDRNVCFRYNGSGDEVATTGYGSIQAQHAGFILANAYGGGQGAPFIMLQITP